MLRKPHKLRVVLLAASCCVLCGVVGARLYELQVLRHDHFSDRARGTHERRFVLQPERGEILDRRGRTLASSTGTLSVYVWPRYFQGPEAEADLEALARETSRLTGVSHESLLARFNGSAITRVGRQLEPEIAHKVMDLFDANGVSSRGYWPEVESKRHYPRALAPHLIGFCGTDATGDNTGLAGLELRYDSILSGQRVEGRSLVTGITQGMSPIPREKALEARGHTLILTLDAAIQETAEKALQATVERHNADSAVVVVQDVETGAILAMASWPSYDNNAFARSETASRRNRALTDPIETGSVAKLFTAAMLLDAGVVNINTLVDCEGGAARIGPRTIRDAPGHRLRVVPFYEAVRHSSNVGIVKLAQEVENEDWHTYLRAFGLGQPSGIDLPGEGAGILRHHSRWDAYSRTSLPMGYEMGLTAIQITNGITGLVNGGELLEPHIVREVRDARGNVVERRGRTVRGRTIRPATSLMIRELMEDVVVNGTGRRAQVPGFRVGGKTGTTRKSHVSTHREYIASFVGVLPIDRPKVTIYCYVDNPKGAFYASEVAAPLFQEVAQAAVLHLGLVPDFPAEIADADGPLRRSFTPDYTVAPTHEDARGVYVPDFLGLSMAEAREQLAGIEAPVRFLGSGRATDQMPLPGASLHDAPEILVMFEPGNGEAYAATRTVAHSTEEQP